MGCGGVAVGLVAAPQACQCDSFQDRGAEVYEPVHRGRVVPSGLVPVTVDVGEQAVAVAGEHLPRTVTDLAGG